MESIHKRHRILNNILHFCILISVFLHLSEQTSKRWKKLFDSTKTNSHNFKYDVNLDADGVLRLFWNIDPVTERITFRLSAKVNRNDFIGVGFSDHGNITNSDWMLIWTNLKNKHIFQDAHGDAGGLLYVDEHQDYKLEGISLDGEATVVTFSRLYDTCDDDDYIIDTGTTHVLWFTIPRRLVTVEGVDLGKVKVGLQRVQLLKSQLPDPVFPPDTKTHTVHVKNVPIPEAETTYWCSVQVLPELSEKHHIIQFEPAISEAGRGIVHHLEMFHCEAPKDVVIPDFNQPCDTMESRPKGLESCRKVIGAWAMGSTGLTYPPEAGQPFGGANFSRYVMLEIHYNNPELKKGLIDSSGLKFYYTPTLRKYDAGTIELGLEYADKLALPPGLTSWKQIGFCVAECTEVAFPPKGIHVFASQLHSHLTGRRLRTKHFRNGVELPELNRDDHWSSHYQEIRKLQRQVHVLPGDALVTICDDSTEDRTKVTLGGFAISDEMCVNYIHYYPVVDLEVCKSSVTTDSLYEFFRFMNEFNGEPNSPSKGISDNYKAIHWTPMNIQFLRTYYDAAPVSMQCNQSNGDRFPGHWENIEQPTILFPLPPTERPCLQ